MGMKHTGLILVLSLAASAAAQQSVPDMLEKVLPGVVTVTTKRGSDQRQGSGLTASDSAYAKALLLNDQEANGGSGFVVEQGGRKYVVTNAHVVAADPASAAIYSLNRTRYQMRLAGLDTLWDLAVLAFEDPGPGPEIRALEFRTAEIRLGESVYAIGNPLSEFPFSVVPGIIGGKNRRDPDLTGQFGFLQSTATLIWGNSGGPLVDADGRVTGINTKAHFHVAGNQTYQQPQINLALEGRIAAPLVAEMLANGGRLKRAYFGLEITADTPANEFSAQPVPCLLHAVIPGSPAAGLSQKLGWRVERIGNMDIETPEDVLEALEQARPGKSVRFELVDPKSSKAEVVNLVPQELTDANSASLGKFVLEQNNFVVTEANGAMLIRRDPNAPSSNTGLTMRAVSTTRRTRPLTAATAEAASPRLPSPLRVIAAGQFGDGSQLYRVRNGRDLGVAFKIAATSGVVDFYHSPEGKGEPVPVTISLSGSLETRRRTILY